MQSDRKPHPERSLESCLRENAALRKQVDWLSRQLYGRAMPGLFTFSGETEDSSAEEDGPERKGLPENRAGTLREPVAPYHVSAPVSVPPDFPSDEVTLELPPAKRGGMSVGGYESAEAFAARPAFVWRTIRRTMYLSNDGSGMPAAAQAPALFPDPSGGPRMFDASFVACVTHYLMAGMTFHVIRRLLETESGLVISEAALRGLVLNAAETVAPVCNAMVARTIPDWMNLCRMFEEAKAGGDWLADEFLQKIHALCELEEHALIRAERLGGAPEDLYRERRIVRTESAKIAAAFFGRCREMLPGQNPESPLAETISYALEHEGFLSEFLYDPRLELSRSNPETPVADPFAVLAVCADECRMRGVSFRAWLEDTLIKLKQPDPPPVKTLFPR